MFARYPSKKSLNFYVLTTGMVEKPSLDEMEKDIKEAEEDEAKIDSMFGVIDFQTQYVQKLGDLLGEPNMDRNHIMRETIKVRDFDITKYKETTSIGALVGRL